MQELNFPTYSFKLKSNENKTLIFDIIRKKYVILTPEEWVRQHMVRFLLEEKKYPVSLLALEKQLHVYLRKKRTDIVVFKPNGTPLMVVECKAPSVSIDQNTFDQIARYNLSLEADLLVVTNGMDHFCCTMDHKNERYNFLKSIPSYQK